MTNLLDGVPVAGRTDWIILHDALKKAGHDLDEDLFERIRDAHHEFLREEILLPGHGVKDIMPGIRELLPLLQSREDVALGLLTGNFEEAARIKLGHFDLWDYFRCGAFGDDAADRNALVPFAVDRARACGLGDFTTPTSSSSATPRATSRARTPSAPCRSRSRRAVTASRSYVEPEPRSCCRI